MKAIALQELCIVGGLGLLFCALGVLFILLQNSKKKKCKQCIEGTVVKYSFPGDGRVAPVVEYSVDGKQYRAKRKFRGYITVQNPSKQYDMNEAHVTDKDYLYLPQKPIFPLKKIAENLWPVGSSMPVYYKKSNPKCAYVEKIPQGVPSVSWIFIFSGLGLMILSVLVAWLMSQ